VESVNQYYTYAG